MSDRELRVVDLGGMSYAEALQLQRDTARGRISGAVEQDVLLLVEHPPVITLGRSAKENNLLSSVELLQARGVELFEVERGGDITFHGPGQLVGYPIINLRRHKQDLHWYLREIEAALMDSLRILGIESTQRAGLTGVWTTGTDVPRKVASIGVHARDWVTWHGFALNVRTDLSFFDLIVPCGISDVVMTSIANEIGDQPDLWERALHATVDSFAGRFQLSPRPLAIDDLQRTLKLSAA